MTWCRPGGAAPSLWEDLFIFSVNFDSIFWIVDFNSPTRFRNLELSLQNEASWRGQTGPDWSAVSRLVLARGTELTNILDSVAHPAESEIAHLEM